MAGSIRCDDTEGRGAIVVQPPLGTVACSGEEGADLDGFDVSYVNGAAPGPCVPVVPIQGFVRAEAGALRLANRPYFALGANVYFLQQMFAHGEAGSVSSSQQAVQALDGVQCLGLSVIRTVGFNNGGDAASIHPQPGVFREQGLLGLDRVVAEAKARGLRVVLTLTNNHPDFGGLPSFAAWEDLHKDDFFRDPRMQQHWKDYASLLATRINTKTGVAYRDEPAILAWEIGNEFRCRSCSDAQNISSTVRELARHLRGLGVQQLISDGGEGFDDDPGRWPGLSNRYPVAGAEGASFDALLHVEEIDLYSYHFYPEAWGLNAGRDSDVWIERHEVLARAKNKVAFLGEFGHLGLGAAQAEGMMPNADRRRAEFYERWLSRWDDIGGALAMVWQVVPPQRAVTGNDGYGVVLDRDSITLAVLRHWAERALLKQAQP